ncbi:MAG TPA: hypothetical protein PLI13_09230 [Paracoccus sp. (in: a-proteobacteria)]|jgi:hypothetical protein|nr:hypothetical protein [Paracoccus sp. (in: a-proteobacteria)]
MTLIPRILGLAVIAALATSGLAVAEPKQTVKRLKNCGSEASNSFGSHKEYPVLDEGNGYVGFKTADQDAGGTKLRYSLVNCATRQIVRLDAEYKLKDSSKGVPGGDLFDFIDSLRKQKRLVNEQLLTKTAQSYGYKVTTGKLAGYGDERAVRADCGCMTHYADMMPYEFIE